MTHQDIARIEKTPAGPKFWIGGALVKRELGTINDLRADALAAEVNAAISDAILAAVAEERERCAEIVLGMRNQRHAYRRIVGDPKARLPEYHHWALPFIDDVTLDELRRAQPLDQWREAEGDVLWWKFPVNEPPYVGSPLDTGWPGYHTHWTRIALPDGPDRQPSLPEKTDG